MNTEKTCQNCKHWKQYSIDRGECYRLTEVGEEIRSEMVVVYDDSIPVVTNKNFGCNLHEHEQ